MLKIFPEFASETKIDIDFIKEACKTRGISPRLEKQYKLIEANLELIETNYKLMQLHDVNISGTSKLRIQEMFGVVNDFNRMAFLSILRTNFMLNSIKNVNVWMNEVFNRLDLANHNFN